MAMATPAAFYRTRRLFSILSSATAKSTPCARPPNLAAEPASAEKAAAGEAEAKPKAGRRIPLGKTLRVISEERDPEKLVSMFIAASASPRFRDNHRVYEVAVSRLASFGRRDGVAALLDSQKRFLEASNEDFAVRIVRLYGRASMPSHAAAAFRGLPPKHKSVTAFNAVLAAYVDTDEFDSLVTAFDEIPASKKAEPSAALDVISLMEKCGLTPDMVTFNSLLNRFYNKGGRFDEAEKIWEMMEERSLQPNAKSYNAKLRGLVAQGRIEDAAAVIERMQKEGPKPDSVSYNELIRGYCKEGRLDETKKVYDDLIKNGCAPNRGTFETLIPCLVEAGELDLALNCCQENFNRKCKVKCSLLQAVVTALVAASRVEEAAGIVKLGWKNNYPLRHLNIPALNGKDNNAQAEIALNGKDNNVEAQTDCNDSVPYKEGSEEEVESKIA